MKFAVVGTPFINEYLKAFDFWNQDDHQVHFFACDTLFDACEVYKTNQDQYDGFLTTGWLVTNAIKKGVSQIGKPLHQIDYDLCNYYEIFFKTAYKLKDMNFDRVYIDLLDFLPEKKSISYYLENGTLGEAFLEVNQVIANMSLNEMVLKLDVIKQKHFELFAQNKIDYSITTSSYFIIEMMERKLNCIYVYPKRIKIKEALQELISKVKIKQLEDAQSVVAYIQLLDSEIDSLVLIKQIKRFMKVSMANIILNFDNQSVSCTFNLKEFLSLTENKQACPIQTFLKEHTELEVFIGYGIANTNFEAVQNAKKAYQEACASREPASYLIDQYHYLVGPLQAGKRLVIKQEVTPQINALAKQLNLSTFTVQKLLHFKQQQADKVTSKSLATYFNISVRNANRILSILITKQQAIILYEQQTLTKGRPEKVYQLLLNVE